MGKHTQLAIVLVCTLSTQREGTVLQVPRGQDSFVQPQTSTQDAWKKRD